MQTVGNEPSTNEPAAQELAAAAKLLSDRELTGNQIEKIREFLVLERFAHLPFGTSEERILEVALQNLKTLQAFNKFSSR